MRNTYIIAEAGVNHNGSVDLAIELIRKAKEAGADCVKFQTFKAEQIVTQSSPKANYQLLVTDINESQFEMLKKLELKMEHYPILLSYCKKIGIDFMSTPYNFEDVDFLDSLEIDSFKIASGQLTEIPFLKYAARKMKKMIVSTGMANISDVFLAVQAIRGEGNDDIIVLQCTTNYPSKIEDSNLLAMLSIRDACKVKVGYSDHVENNYACLASVALGAEIVEKHFTLDKNMDGPDHSCSLEPNEFNELVIGIRNIELALGNGLKVPTNAELGNSTGMKRSLVAITNIKKGEKFKGEQIGFKRPFNGLSPNMLPDILGKEALKDIERDEPIQYNSVKW
jgi:N-acetylneuraminate synthase/N,N'-diacetyllegionaminate synthase